MSEYGMIKYLKKLLAIETVYNKLLKYFNFFIKNKNKTFYYTFFLDD